MLRDIIPAKYRQIVYTLLGALFGLEAIFDLIDGATEGRILAAAAVLGFTVAAGNTPKA